jgi:ABC-type polar amino acid transport system ATPase subunit
VIRIRGLHKRHGDRHILRGIDATVDKAETVAIVGPSGGGKSTLLRALNYLDSFDEGTVDIAGFQLRPGMDRRHREELRKLRCKVGMVFQQFHLFPHLTALENITLAPRITRGISAAEADKTARELLGRVGLGDRGGSYPAQLSGGQQQRVAIARALAQQPEVLLFDEPTSALDPEMRDEVLAVIRELDRDHGMTMLVVTHEMHFAHDVADRVWVMDGGVIVEDGPPSEVVDAPKSAVGKEYFKRIKRPGRDIPTPE